MRKDVQLGLGIGGVFLAVLIVWGVVLSGSRKHQTKQVSLEATGKQPVTTGGTGTGEIPPAKAPVDERSADPAVTPPPVNFVERSTPVSPIPTESLSTNTPPVATGDSTEKKDINWHALLLADRPEELPGPLHTSTPAAAPDATQIADARMPRSATPGMEAIPMGKGSTTPHVAGSSVDSASSMDPTPRVSTGAVSGRTHIVQQDETYSSISKAIYGTSRYYLKIQKANPSVDPLKLKPGMVITLPDISDIKTETSAASNAGSTSTGSHSTSAKPRSESRRPVALAATVTNGGTEYKVVAHDSLYRISVRLYGSGEEVDHLYELNKSAIGPDKSRLKLGMVLKLPAPPTATASR